MNQIKIVSIAFLITVASSITAQAQAERIEREPRDRGQRSAQETKETAPGVVRWRGTLQDDSSSHTTEHEHRLRFVRHDDQKVYDMEIGPELARIHHETEKNLIVEVEVERTSRFLFWGGNLVVRRFTILGSAGEAIPHRELASDQKIVTPAGDPTEGMLGTLQCDSRRYKPNEIIEINFVDASTGDSTKVSNPTRDLKALCPQISRSEQKVRVVGERTGRFLFWGGNLKVSKVSLADAG